MRGHKFLLFIFLPISALIAVAFFFVQPHVTQTPPNTLRTYLFFTDQYSIQFLSQEDIEPHTIDIDFQQASSGFAFTAEKLRKDKNWIPLHSFPPGEIEVTARSKGYPHIHTTLLYQDNALIPHPEHPLPKPHHAAHNYLELRFSKD